VGRTITALVTALWIAAPAAGQTPQQHLEEARKLLHDTAVPPDSDAAKRLSSLQQNFADFAGAYLMQERAGTTEPSDAAGAARPDWRSRYLVVEADLTTLLGPPNAPEVVAGMTGLDAQARDRLRQVRTHLQTFYAATMGSREGNPVAHTGSAPNEQAPVVPTAAAPQTPPATRATPEAADSALAATTAATQETPARPRDQPTTPTAGIDPATALLLLDRIQSILDEAVKGESPTSVTAIGTSGTSGGNRSAAGGKVTIDRGLLDEIRAELSQIRALLQK
jgi:hypothetical protein